MALNQFNQNQIRGLNTHEQVKVATTTALIITASGSKSTKILTATSNGVISIDDINLNLNDRVLVKDQPTPFIDNGMYYVSQVGDDTHPFILHRTNDFDNNPDVEAQAGDYVFVEQGTINGSNGFILRAYNGEYPIIDTDPLIWVQFTGTIPIIKGSNTFAGNLNPRVITFETAMPNSNYIVQLTPIGTANGRIGEWGVAKTTTDITITNTGDATTSFDYTIFY